MLLNNVSDPVPPSQDKFSGEKVVNRTAIQMWGAKRAKG